MPTHTSITGEKIDFDMVSPAEISVGDSVFWLDFRTVNKITPASDGNFWFHLDGQEIKVLWCSYEQVAKRQQ